MTPCGCRVEFFAVREAERGDGGDVAVIAAYDSRIVYCPTHAAAFELLESLKACGCDTCVKNLAEVLPT